MPIKFNKWKRPKKFRRSLHPRQYITRLDSKIAQILCNGAPVEVEYLLKSETTSTVDGKERVRISYNSYILSRTACVESIAHLDVHIAERERDPDKFAFELANLKYGQKFTIEEAITRGISLLEDLKAQRRRSLLMLKIGHQITAVMECVRHSTHLRIRHVLTSIEAICHSKGIKFLERAICYDGVHIHVWLDGAQVRPVLGNLLDSFADDYHYEWAIDPADPGHMIMVVPVSLITRKGFIQFTGYLTTQEMVDRCFAL